MAWPTGDYPAGYAYSNEPAKDLISPSDNGRAVHDAEATGYWGKPFEVGDVVGVAFDTTNLDLYFSINGVWQEGASSNSEKAFESMHSDTYYAAAGFDTSYSLGNGQLTANFDGDAVPFVYGPPDGYVAAECGTWNTDFLWTGAQYSNGNLTVRANSDNVQGGTRSTIAL